MEHNQSVHGTVHSVTLHYQIIQIDNVKSQMFDDDCWHLD